MSLPLQQALSAIPEPFRGSLATEYEECQRAAVLSDWEKVGLKAGKICEIAYCILEGLCTGVYPATIQKPRNMQDACRALEQRASGDIARPIKIQLPRMVAAVYELRNNRAIGHASGDLSPNEMDGLLFDRSIKWMVAELVRSVSAIPSSNAQALIDDISSPWSRIFWKRGERRRVLKPGVSLMDQVLVLLYHSGFAATVGELRSWLDVSNITNFKARQLDPLHRASLIDWHRKADIVALLPPGAEKVEQEILGLGL